MKVPDNLPFWMRDWRRALPIAGGVLALILVAVYLPSKGEGGKKVAKSLAADSTPEPGATLAPDATAPEAQVDVPGGGGTTAATKAKVSAIASKPRGGLEGAGGGTALPFGVKQGVPWDGKNGGATYRGVTPNEIRVLFHYTKQSCGDSYAALVNQALNFKTGWEQTVNPLVKYFNERGKFIYGRGQPWLESYYSNGYFGRKIVVDHQPDDGGPFCEEKARGLAREADQSKKYFAAVAAGYGAERFWAESLTGRCERKSVGGPAPASDCTMHMGAFWYRDDWYNLRDPFVWAHWSSSTRTAQGIASWIGANMVNRPVSFTDDPVLKPLPRKYAILGNDNDEGRKVVKEIQSLMAQYGAPVDDKNVVLFPTTSLSERQSLAPNAMAQLRSNSVTTIINNTSVLDPLWIYPAATGQQYYPEWVASSLQYQDINLAGRAYQTYGGKEQVAHTVGETTLIAKETLQFRPEQTQPAFAWCVVQGKVDAKGAPTRECARSLPDDLAQWYYPISLLFGLISASGPALSPQNALAGLEASCNPCAKDAYITQLYGYNRLDHTSVDDHMAIRWDADKRDVSANYSQYEDTDRDGTAGNSDTDQPPKGTFVPVAPYPSDRGPAKPAGTRCRDFTKPETCN